MGSDKARSVIAMIAGLLGAAGVALAAVAAHRVDDPKLVTAANFLIFHAAAAVGLAALSASVSGSGRGLMTFSAGLMLFGAALFSGSIASTVFLGQPLFPMSAPIGGSTLIGSWLLVAVGGLLSAFSRRSQ